MGLRFRRPFIFPVVELRAVFRTIDLAREEIPRVQEHRVGSYAPLCRVLPDWARCRLAGVAAHCSLTVTDLYCSYHHRVAGALVFTLYDLITGALGLGSKISESCSFCVGTSSAACGGNV